MLHMRNDAKPMFCKARPVPYALKPKVVEEIENLENMGILQKVETNGQRQLLQFSRKMEKDLWRF